ncbi:coproporphyrinogen III oxidase, anaerobic [Limimonas halophila]|uniref:Coproporphyrinogen-III oxidase n=1 Tax=Limimonas halophila TaxID=1082479 RepID=A0A1G7QRK6_9PROT|nr:oxygen-independent coproporphyrinogen III oxidase [Limimonas halophila]SDG01113.1 coproporphyrinogen III oxidase, anaerobic [Limimonas halophila]
MTATAAAWNLASNGLDVAVPRYTSFPTATQFDGAVGDDTLRGWLAAHDGVSPISLYIHVPYCRQLCWYCGCHTRAASRNEPLAAYAETVIAHLRQLTASLGTRAPLTHLHFGGGTPSILVPDSFHRIMAAVDDLFAIRPDAELAMELDPRTITPDMAGELAAAGINRVSLGVQTFDETVQAAINRVQPYRQVAESVAAVRAAGIAGLNVDLMYGLPHQTAASVAETAECVAGLTPDRLAVFGYAHVPWAKPHQRQIDSGALPGMQARLDQARTARTVLQAAGYRAIGIDHFAKPADGLARAHAAGTLRRNFQGYTDDPCQWLLGVGASAISAVPQGYAQASPHLRTYRHRVRDGGLAIHKGIEVSAEDACRRSAITTLMAYQTVDLAACAQAHGYAPQLFANGWTALAPLERQGLLERRGWRVTLAPEAWPWTRLACSAFDPYFAPSDGHSRAV